MTSEKFNLFRTKGLKWFYSLSRFLLIVFVYNLDCRRIVLLQMVQHGNPQPRSSNLKHDVENLHFTPFLSGKSKIKESKHHKPRFIPYKIQQFPFSYLFTQSNKDPTRTCWHKSIHFITHKPAKSILNNVQNWQHFQEPHYQNPKYLATVSWTGDRLLPRLGRIPRDIM